MEWIKKGWGEEEMERDWHIQVYPALFWHKTWSTFSFPNVLLRENELKKNKIQTLNRKLHVSLHFSLLSPYCVRVSIFKEQPPPAGDWWFFSCLQDCCLFLVEGPSIHRCAKQAHSPLDQESLQCKKQILVGFCFVFCMPGVSLVCLFVSSLWTKCTEREKKQIITKPSKHKFTFF